MSWDPRHTVKKTWGLGGSGGGKAVPQSWRTRESQRWQGGLEGGTNGGVVQVGHGKGMQS